MDTFRALNELATILASCDRAVANLGEPAPLKEGDRHSELHHRAHLALKSCRDRADQARIAVEKLDPQRQMEVV